MYCTAVVLKGPFHRPFLKLHERTKIIRLYAERWGMAGTTWRHRVCEDPREGGSQWPVHNSDFRRWQDAHNAGGDRVLFSDYRVVKINPIKFGVPK
ncbi:DUF6402 family protein [Paraburkholderia sp. Ac-20336]|uniref:DUF6402 family protein n=1 Tax=Paraburkholderia sp. Ac-20336 TaxID=2703886 RepID=UPI003216D1AD